MTQTDRLLQALQTTFGYDDFKLGQREIIADILAGNDVLGTLPTGSGKSLCYQLPATLLNGVTIVVSPLISLMIDQVREVKAYYFKNVCALHSMQSFQERSRTLQHLHEYKLIYISPELIQRRAILEKIQQLNVSLFVIDEAHCLSQWGYDFRPDYLRLVHVIEQLHNPRVLALSGTVTPKIQQEITHILHRPNMHKHIYPMDRENIALTVRHVANESKKNELLIKKLTTYHVPTIIYFSSRKKTEEIAEQLQKQLTHKRIAYYHGKLEATERLKIQQQFMYDQLDIICCTSAFGMGINKGNVRLVIHYHLPTQIESFIQEIGRAGRDNVDSISLLILSPDDVSIPLHIINHELPDEAEIARTMHILFDQKNNMSLDNDKSIVEKLNITETKWRVIKYYLEQAALIKNNELQRKNKLDVIKFQAELNEHLQERLLIKHNNLQKLVQWTETDQCLRKQLYKPFQESIQIRKEQCCSNCHFSFQTWYTRVKQVYAKQKSSNDWKTQLQHILLIGDSNETSG